MSTPGDNKPKPKTRDEFRAALLATHKPKTALVTLFGTEIELRQPTLEAIMAMKDQATAIERLTHMLVNYAVVPGTDTPIFEPADAAAIAKWPWGADLTKVQTAVMELTGIDINAAKEDLKKDPS